LGSAVVIPIGDPKVIRLHGRGMKSGQNSTFLGAVVGVLIPGAGPNTTST
jgi:hypothetical protein